MGVSRRTLVSFLGAALVTATPGRMVARAAGEASTYYAYGLNINGLPFFYSDGLAYVGYDRPDGSREARNITLAPMSDASTTFSAAPSDGNITGWTDVNLFIDTSANAYEGAGFIAGSSNNSSIETTGFLNYGTQLAWEDDNGEVNIKWWAQKVDTELYAVKWNQASVQKDNAVPIVIKATAPTTLD